ncbi:MAG: hypothetical protein ACP5JR_06135 [Thermoplasmata archaeon]
MALIDGARNVLKTCLDLKPKEKLLIITDTEKEKIGDVFFEAAYETGSEVVMLKLPVAEKDGAEPLESVAKFMCEMDVIIILTKYSMTHTVARREANKKARIVSIPDVVEVSVSSG